MGISTEAVLFSAAQRGDTGVVVAMLAAGADLHDMNDYAFRTAVYFGGLETVKVLLAAGANVHANQDEALLVARRFAAKWGDATDHQAILALLEEFAQQPRSPAEEKQAAFWGAANRGDAERVKALLAEGTDVHGDDDYALRAAVYEGHVETVRVLLAAGANLRAGNGQPLRAARRFAEEFSERHVTILALLEEHRKLLKRHAVDGGSAATPQPS